MRRRRLVLEPRDHHRQYVDAPVLEIVDQLQGVGVIGDAEIGPHLFPLDVAGINAEDDVGLVGELLEKAHFHVGIISGKHPRRVIIEHELAAEFQVELVIETLPARGSTLSAP